MTNTLMNGIPRALSFHENFNEIFKGQLEETVRLYTLLANIRFGNTTKSSNIQKMYTDARYLADVVEYVRVLINLNLNRTDKVLTPEMQLELDAFEQVASYFENEVLDYKTYQQYPVIKPILYPDDHKYAGRQMVENKKVKYMPGTKKNLIEITLNEILNSTSSTVYNSTFQNGS